MADDIHPDDINPDVNYRVMAYDGVVMFKDVKTNLRITLNRQKKEVIVDYPNQNFSNVILPVLGFADSANIKVQQTE